MTPTPNSPLDVEGLRSEENMGRPDLSVSGSAPSVSEALQAARRIVESEEAWPVASESGPSFSHDGWLAATALIKLHEAATELLKVDGGEGSECYHAIRSFDARARLKATLHARAARAKAEGK